ncbi:MAG: hypothetical protein V1879_06595 [Pseudomonadota bacterium]
MLIRLALLITILLVATSAILYFFTRDLRYAGFAWQVLRFMMYVLLVSAALYLLERYGLVAWRVFV